MAKENKYPPHGITMYNKRGEYIYCYNDSDVVHAKEQGYTSTKYVRSHWPKMVWNKNTGESKPIGKVAFTDEQNEKLLADLGPHWTTERVAPPPAKVAPAAAPQGDGQLLNVLAEMLASQKTMNERFTSMEEALLETNDRNEQLAKELAALKAKQATAPKQEQAKQEQKA